MEVNSHPVIANGDKQTILFNSKSKGFSVLSNSYVTDIVIDGLTYYHVEGYYQSSRFTEFNVKAAEHVRNIYSPMACRKASNAYFIPKEYADKWNSELKVKIMKRAILVKFTTNKDLHDLLLSTGNANLMENAPNDEFWGSGKEGKGMNVLGKILMEVRTCLQHCNEFDNFYF